MNNLRAENEMFENMHPSLNNFFIGLLYSNEFIAHIWMITLAKIIKLKVNSSKLSQ